MAQALPFILIVAAYLIGSIPFSFLVVKIVAGADIRAHGLFSFHYLPRNLWSAFLLLPSVDLRPLRIGYDPNGMSLFVTTPLFALLLFPRYRPRLDD